MDMWQQGIPGEEATANEDTHPDMPGNFMEQQGSQWPLQLEEKGREENSKQQIQRGVIQGRKEAGLEYTGRSPNLKVQCSLFITNVVYSSLMS